MRREHHPTPLPMVAVERRRWPLVQPIIARQLVLRIEDNAVGIADSAPIAARAATYLSQLGYGPDPSSSQMAGTRVRCFALERPRYRKLVCCVLQETAHISPSTRPAKKEALDVGPTRVCALSPCLRPNFASHTSLEVSLHLEGLGFCIGLRKSWANSRLEARYRQVFASDLQVWSGVARPHRLEPTKSR